MQQEQEPNYNSLFTFDFLFDDAKSESAKSGAGTHDFFHGGGEKQLSFKINSEIKPWKPSTL